MPRSGTTWVGQVLCAGRTAGTSTSRSTWRPRPGRSNPRRPLVPVYHRGERGRGSSAPVAGLGVQVSTRPRASSCRSRNDLLHTLKSWGGFVRSRGRRPLVKEPHAVFSAEWFAHRLESDVVVVVRRPAAVVSSWKRLEWSFDFSHLLHQHRLIDDRLARFPAEMEAALDPSRDLVDRVALLVARDL